MANAQSTTSLAREFETWPTSRKALAEPILKKGGGHHVGTGNSGRGELAPCQGLPARTTSIGAPAPAIALRKRDPPLFGVGGHFLHGNRLHLGWVLGILDQR